MRPWTVGVKEELALVDGETWAVADRADELLVAVGSAADLGTSPGTQACVVELGTAVHETVSSLTGELLALRGSIEATAGELGLRLAAAGTHPLAGAAQVTSGPAMALRVHVGVPDERTATRALAGLRQDLPLLLALSANSPFWRGADTGFASIRTALFAAAPRWDLRLRPRLGTLEVRVMDAQTSVEDVGAMAALVQALVRHRGEVAPEAAPPSEILAENRFLGARDGMSAWFIDGAGPRRPAGDALGRLLEALAPVAERLGCAEQLADAAVLAETPAYARQRATAATHGIGGVPFRLAAAFARNGPAVAAA